MDVEESTTLREELDVLLNNPSNFYQTIMERSGMLWPLSITILLAVLHDQTIMEIMKWYMLWPLFKKWPLSISILLAMGWGVGVGWGGGVDNSNPYILCLAFTSLLSKLLVEPNI